MKYSILIDPINENSYACQHALSFILAAVNKNHQVVSVFFYGYAVKQAFFNDNRWDKLRQLNIPLIACSTIAENKIEKNKVLSPNFSLAGLGQWMDSVLSSEKSIEFK
jgi:sulfur relay (sulfurtransferase) complex TusBCD TusD component (DsrE family)